jgi:parallel beta-helix repeat protein
LRQPVTIYLRGGIYFLTEPITITPEHSGTEKFPVTIAAYRNERPILSGGRKIVGWKPTTVNGRKVWSAEIPEVKEGKWFFRQLWVNGKRAIRARHPNKGYLQVAEVLDVTPQTQWHEGQKRFRFQEGDLKAWSTVSDAEIVVMNRWVESRLPVVKVDESQRVVECAKRSVFKLDVGDPYYLEHCLEVLDAPGEWFLDKRTGTLYYMPGEGEDMKTAEVIAPVLTQIVRMVGEPKAGQWVEHIVWKGITFSHAEWYFPEASKRGRDVGGFAQAAVEVPGAVYGEGVRRCTFENCTIEHVGTYGLELARGCHENRIVSCTLRDLGAGGIKIGETQIRSDEAERTFGNEIGDCTIVDGGKMFHSAVGIWIGQSPKNRIIHNEIADFYYTGISIGWTWGYGNSLAGGNIVEFNHVHHIGKKSDGDGPILSDMGGIYTLGIQHGTVIRNNLWHDIAGLRYGGWGIYFDEGSTGIIAENNIVYNTTHGGFHQHYGRENIVRNNIFAYGRDWQIQVTRPEPHLRFRFEGNIVIGTTERWVQGNIGDFNFVFDRNLYWREGGGQIKFGNLTWDEWQAKGMDKNSLIADPQFVDAPRRNFRLKPNSPAFSLGFKPFDLTGVGPRKKLVR